MRIAHSTVILLALAGVASAQPKPQPAQPRTLEAPDVEASVKPVATDIERCYLDAAGEVKGTARLEISLAIHRTGLLDSVDVATPGLPAKAARKVDSCVRSLVEKLRFPARRSSTTAVVPYSFHKVDAPNAGPQLSCWSPKGCK
jgi:hypothetical protein